VTVLVDTSIWSLALRRRSSTLSPVDSAHILELTTLVRTGRAGLIGPIRQEVLSGVRDAAQFTRLRDRLSAFADLAIEDTDYLRAAEAFNACRRHGVSGSTVDMLICAVAGRLEAPVFTTDGDFTHYAKHVAFRLHHPRIRAVR